ncbi:MAG: flagellar basal body rod protein FlgB [bacterium]|jgi:flagellar basal-body rod protein FlgB
MFIGKLFDSTTLTVLKKGIEGTNLRHEAISNNIANVDTPQYQRAVVDFETQLRRALRGQDVTGQRSHPAHFVIGGPKEVAQVTARIDIDDETRFRPDRNNVNIDQEMANLAQNTARNLQFTELLTRRYAGMRTVIMSAAQT